METTPIISSLLVALILLPLLAAKWQIRIRLSLFAAVIVGLLAASITIWFNYRFHLSLPAMVLLETFLILFLIALTVLFRFYRDPERTPVYTENVVLSPADGEVLYVKRIDDTASATAVKGGNAIRLEEITKVLWPSKRTYLIGIGMNLLNVHVNRAPVAGKVVVQKRTRGKFLSLRKTEAEVLNERLTTVIKGDVVQVAMVQIASRLVRGIISYVKEGEEVNIAQRVGMIRFGSQVDVLISEVEGCEMAASPGDKVTAGISVIMKYKLPNHGMYKAKVEASR